MLDCTVSLPLPRALRTGFHQATEARALMLRATCASVTERKHLVRALQVAASQWTPPLVELTTDWSLMSDGVVAARAPLGDRRVSGLYEQVQQVMERVLGRAPVTLARFSPEPFGSTAPVTWQASELVVETVQSDGPAAAETFCVMIGPAQWGADPVVTPLPYVSEVAPDVPPAPEPMLPPRWAVAPAPAPPIVEAEPAAPPAPVPAQAVSTPAVRLFERHGFLDGSVLDLGGPAGTGFARVGLQESGQDRSPLHRRWRTVVVTVEHTQALPTLLAARGLLAAAGCVLLARPATDDPSVWEQVFAEVFTVEPLLIPGYCAWRLTPVGASIETVTEAATAAPPAPAINVVVNVPEQHLRVLAPVTNHFAAPDAPRITVNTPDIKIPKQDAPTVNIMPGAVQVNIPPPAAKKIEVQKDPYGKLIGVLTPVSENEPPKEHSGRLGREP